MKTTFALVAVALLLMPSGVRAQTRQLTFPLGFAVDFGQVHVLSSGTQLDKMNIVVRNTGTAPVTITSAVLNGDPDFVLSNAPLTVSGPIAFPVVLQPGQVTALVYVHFLPTQVGIRTAAVTITSDAIGSPHTVNHRAEAVDTPLGPWPWTLAGRPLGERLVNSIVVDPDDEDVLYVTSMSGLYVSRDGGASWVRSLTGTGINGGIMGGDSFAIDPTDSRRIYASFGRDLYGSDDKGLTWRVLLTAAGGLASMTVGTNGAIYTTTGFGPGGVTNPGMYKSSNLGASWTFHSFGITQANIIAWDIARDPVGGALYVVTEIGDHPQPYNPPLFRSMDDGVTWQDVSGTLPWHGAQVQVDPSNQNVYVLQEGPGLYRSSNFGASWDYLSNSFYLEFALDESHPGRQYGGAHYLAGGGVFVSTDGGLAFDRIGLSNMTIGSVATNRAGTRVYATAYGAGVFVSAVGLSPDGLTVDFAASHGLWRHDGAHWTQVHPVSPEATVSCDLDGNGIEDLVADFGPGVGVWTWLNRTTWSQLHGLSPSLMVAADLDHNLRDEVILDFPGYGLWAWSNNATWTWLHPFDADAVGVGNVDGSAGDDLIIDFPGYGVWVWSNGAWTQWHSARARAVVTADLDGNGTAEAVVDFPGYGLWIRWNNSTWSQLHGLSARHMAAGDLDGNSVPDLVVDFGAPHGIWTFRSGTSWVLLHPLTSEGFVLVERDEGSGRDELVVDFGAVGMWQYWNDSVWSRLHPLNAEGMSVNR